MRRAARVDANQAEIVRAFRTLGCSVKPTHTLGQGFTDIICGLPGVNFLVEIKDGSRPPSEQQLTPDEIRFHAEWKGPIRVVRSVDDVLDVVVEMKAMSKRMVA